MKLVLRIYAQCASPEEALSLQNRMMKVLEGFNPRATVTPEQYWKIPEYYYFEFALTPADHQNFKRIIGMASGNWLHMGEDDDLSSVWNKEGEDNFLIPEVQWVEVQLYPS